MANNNSDLHQQFLLNPDVIFLNHGSFGATPRPVFEAYQRWQRELETQPVEFLGRRAPDLLQNSRTILAKYLQVDCHDLAYIPNATTGINIVARSLQLHEGDEVLASNHEYGAINRTWTFLSEKNGFKYINHPIRTPVSALPQNKCYFESNRCLMKDVTLRQRLSNCRGSNDESTQQTRIIKCDPPTISKGEED